MRIGLVPMVDLQSIQDEHVQRPLVELAMKYGLMAGSGNAVKFSRVWAQRHHHFLASEISALRALFNEVPDVHASVWVTWS